MTWIILSLLILCGLSSALGIVSACLIKPQMLFFNASKSQEENYHRIWNLEISFSLAQSVLLFAEIVLIFISCIKGEVLNEDLRWPYAFGIGLVTGVVIGELYYHIVRDPFFQKNMPEIYQAYKSKERRTRYIWLEAVIDNFGIPIESASMFVVLLIIVLS